MAQSHIAVTVSLNSLHLLWESGVRQEINSNLLVDSFMCNVLDHITIKSVHLTDNNKPND